MEIDKSKFGKCNYDGLKWKGTRAASDNQHDKALSHPFTQHNGWKRREGIGQMKISGDAKSADLTTEVFLPKMSQLIEIDGLFSRSDFIMQMELLFITGSCLINPWHLKMRSRIMHLSL